MTVIRTDDPTKLPGMPRAPAGATAEEKRWYDTITQILEIRLGLRGDPRDRAITLRELISSGLAIDLKASPFNPNAIGGINIGFSNPQVPNLDMPPTPTGFTANGAYSQVNLFWDFPLYQNHAHTELWRGSTDIIGDAQLLGIELGRSFVDAVGSGQSNYYWIRHVSQDGVFGFFNSTSGTLGATAVDVVLLLGVLNGAITSSELANSLSTPIAAIPGIQITLSDIDTDISGINTDISGINSDLSGINTDISGINTDISGINTDISTLSSNVNTITTTLASTVTTSSLTTALGSYTTTTSLESNYYTLNEADSAIQAAVLGLASTTQLNTALGSYTSTADLTNNYYTKTSADSAIAAQINTYNTNTIGPTYTSTADLTQNYYTKTSADSAIAAAITSYNTNTIGANYTNSADLVQNHYTKTSADSAIAAAITTYNTNTIGANYTSTADLTQNYYTKTGADSAISAAITTYNTNTIGANYTSTAALTQNYYTKTGADSAISTAITNYNSNTIGANYSTTADIAQNYYTKTQANTAFASTSDILNAQVDDPDGGSNQVTLAQAMSTQADVNGDLKGQYTVKIDANGAVAGFGLASTTTSLGANESEFYVNADRFAIMRGGSDTTAATTPFVVQATATTINGVAVPAGVYMTDAFIRNGAIVNAKIANAAIDNAKISSLSADKITAGTISTSRLNIDGATLSANSSGELVVNAINASQITAGSINATVMSGTTVYADNLTGDVSKLLPFRSTAQIPFLGNAASGGGTKILTTQQLPASTHPTGHKAFASVTGWYDSTANKTYSFRLYMQDTAGSSQSLGTPSGIYLGYGSRIVQFSGDKTSLVQAGQTITATGKSHPVTSVTYSSGSNVTSISYGTGSGGTFTTSDSVTVSASSGYVLVGETRFKANTGLYAQFALSGSLTSHSTGLVNMKLEVTRTGASGIYDNDNSTATDVVSEVSGFMLGAR